MNQRRVVVIGAGKVGLQIVRDLPRDWSVTVVDVDEAALAALPAQRGRGVEPPTDVHRVRGDACSRLTLEAAQLGPRVTLAVVTGSDAVNREVVRLAREVYKVEDLVVRLEDDTDLSGLPLQAAEVISGFHATANLAINRLCGTETRAVALGLGQGELRQVTVLAGSAVAGQALRDIHPQRWLVAAVYRDDSLIVPHGDTVLEEGDRVLLVGSPEVLDGVGDFIRGGRPVFPGQYGARLGVVGDDKVLEEAEALRGPLSVEAVDRVDLDALRPDQSTDAQVRNHLATLHLGLLLLPPSPVPYLARIGLQRSTRKRLLLAARLPVLVARGSAPYRRVLVAGDSDADLEHLARVAVDVARLCGAQLRVLTVTPPALAVGADDLASHEAVPRRMAHLARLHGVEAEVTIDRGNPIERIRHHAREADLLVIGISPKRRSTIFDPDVSLHLLHDCPCSTLFVPSNRAGR